MGTGELLGKPDEMPRLGFRPGGVLAILLFALYYGNYDYCSCAGQSSVI